SFDRKRFPFSAVINLPLKVRSAEVASKVYLDLLLDYEPSGFEDFQIITAFTTEAAYIETIKPVKTRADLDGSVLRAEGPKVPVLQALGASAVGMPISEVAQGLETGVIDGQVSSRETLQDFGFAETLKYVT